MTALGSMAGVTSASMFMHIVENKTYGNRAYHQPQRADGEDPAHGG